MDWVEFFEMFKDRGPSSPYSLRTNAGLKEMMGRRRRDSGEVVESKDGTIHITLPSLIELNKIPNDRCEIPTPCSTVLNSSKDNRTPFPNIDQQAPMLMLFGRDVIRVHSV